MSSLEKWTKAEAIDIANGVLLFPAYLCDQPIDVQGPCHLVKSVVVVLGVSEKLQGSLLFRGAYNPKMECPPER